MLKQSLRLCSLTGLLFMATRCLCQPYVDPVSFNARFFQAAYKDSIHGVNQTVDYNLNLFLPKEFKNGNTFLLRINSEQIHSGYFSGASSYSSNLYSLSMPVGMQFLSKNKKWKSLVMAIPKISTDFRDNLSKDFQLGGIGMLTYVKNENLKFKLGLYYSPEFWGNFFVPLVGMDWKINKHLSLYGVLPSNYRVEYKWNNRLYTGVAFKSYQRSYRLCGAAGNDFVRVKDTQLKAFADYFIYKKTLVFAEVAYGLQYSLVRYSHDITRDYSQAAPLYSPVHNGFLFTLGVAYRIRLDLTVDKVPDNN